MQSTTKVLLGTATVILVLIGPLLAAIPVSPDLSMRAAIALLSVCFGFVILSRVPGSWKFAGFLSGFAVFIVAVPTLAKGYDSFPALIIFSGALGFLAFKYVKTPSVYLVAFTLSCLYFIAYFLVRGSLDDVFVLVVDGTEAGVSKNFIVILLLHYYLLYYATSIKESHAPRHWPIVALPVMAVMSSGVASTVVAALLLLGWLLWLLRVRVLHSIIIIAAIAVISPIVARSFQESELYGRLNDTSFVVSRVLLWSDFASKLDTRSLLVGFDRGTGFIEHDVSLAETENAHSSYLNLYARVGIFSIAYLALIIYTVCALYRINKMLSMVFAATLLRAVTDGYYFSSFLIDCVIFYLFLITPLGLKVRSATRRQSALSMRDAPALGKSGALPPIQAT